LKGWSWLDEVGRKPPGDTRTSAGGLTSLDSATADKLARGVVLMAVAHVNYKPKQFNLSGLQGISDETLEMHFKLYEATSPTRTSSPINC